MIVHHPELLATRFFVSSLTIVMWIVSKLCWIPVLCERIFDQKLLSLWGKWFASKTLCYPKKKYNLTGCKIINSYTNIYFIAKYLTTKPIYEDILIRNNLRLKNVQNPFSLNEVKVLNWIWNGKLAMCRTFWPIPKCQKGVKW